MILKIRLDFYEERLMLKVEKIGMIGLGAMGMPMAVNLVKAGKTVFGYDLSEKQRKQFLSEGGVSCKDIKETVKDADVVLMSLPNSAIVESTMLSDYGVLKNAKEGCYVVDLSSVGPASSKKIYLEAEKRGISYMDAPVSGGVKGAAGGSLTIMVGGDEDAFEAVYPILKILGKKITRIGQTGSGDAIKIINNLMLGCNMAAIAEAMNLGKKLGLSYETMRDIILGSSGNSYVFSVKINDFIIPGNFDGGFATELQLKDLNLALEEAKNCKSPLPMTALASQIFEMSISMGNGKKDISSAILLWDKIRGGEE